MSKDSSHTYLHMHHPHLADVFEDFTRPHNAPTSSLAATVFSSASGSAAATAAAGETGPSHPSFLPVEEIYVPPQYQPLNPEDEDDVVPAQHAAFGITSAMDRRREPVWRDLGLEELVRGARAGGAGPGTISEVPGKRTDLRLKQAGRVMGGKRTLCSR